MKCAFQVSENEEEMSSARDEMKILQEQNRELRRKVIHALILRICCNVVLRTSLKFEIQEHFFTNWAPVCFISA